MVKGCSIFNGGIVSVSMSLDGGNWQDITNFIVGPIYIETETGDMAEISPDNPLYAELVDILEHPLPSVRW